MINLDILMQLNNPRIVKILHQNYRGWEHYTYLYRLTTIAALIITVVAVITVMILQKKAIEHHKVGCADKLLPTAVFLLLGIPFLMFCFHIYITPHIDVNFDFIDGSGYLDNYEQKHPTDDDSLIYFKRMPKIDKISWESLPKIRREQKQAKSSTDKYKYQYYYNLRKQTNLVRPWHYDNQKYHYYMHKYDKELNRSQDSQNELRGVLDTKAPKKLKFQNN